MSASAAGLRHPSLVHSEWCSVSHSACCRVTVRDNGKGFDPRQPRKTSLGLIGMQERVLMAGGDIDIDSEPGRGTVLVVRVPAGSDAVQPASQ